MPFSLIGVAPGWRKASRRCRARVTSPWSGGYLQIFALGPQGGKEASDGNAAAVISEGVAEAGFDSGPVGGPRSPVGETVAAPVCNEGLALSS